MINEMRNSGSFKNSPVSAETKESKEENKQLKLEKEIATSAIKPGNSTTTKGNS
jgi:hypothetical protein